MSETNDELSDAVLARGIRVCVAESLTCGLLANELGKSTDAGEWFAGGVIAYQTNVKERVLGLRPGADPVSAECAEQLARAARELLGADISVSATGVGGPDDEGGHRAGVVYLGWSTSGDTGHRAFVFEGGPEQILEQTIAEARRLLGDLVVQPSDEAEPRAARSA
jgi:nicotinamide-nucleotide amidase